MGSPNITTNGHGKQSTVTRRGVIKQFVTGGSETRYHRNWGLTPPKKKKKKNGILVEEHEEVPGERAG